MNGMSDWFENNWIDLARLAVQLAIFAAIVRYGRKLLATLRASQEQVGALLKLSVSGAAEQRSAMATEQPALAAEQHPIAAEPSKRFEAPSLNIREPEPARRREPEPEPEPVFAGGYSRPSYVAERDSRPSYLAAREQSLGGRLTGTQAPTLTPPTFAPPTFSPATQKEESPAVTPWVSAPAMEPERLNIPATPPLPPLAPRPSASSWLQAPVRSSSASPWRKMVRWLQAPASS
jgi:hypothetical protein